jgi:hypothetical protein
MSVYIACDKCEKRLKIPESVVGRDIKCPVCGNVFKSAPEKVQPSKAAVVAPVAIAPVATAPAAIEDEEEVIAAPKKPAVPEDDEELVVAAKKKPAVVDDEEEAIVPAKRKPAVIDDEDEDEVVPAKKKKAPVAEDDEEEAAPAVAAADEEDEAEDEAKAAKKARRRTPWYVMLPLLILSLGGGAGLAGLWTIGFTVLDLDRGLKFLGNYEHKVWIGVVAAGVVTLLCLLVTLIPMRSWLRFLLVFFFLGLGYGGSFAAIHWWDELPLIPDEPKVQLPEHPPGMGEPGGRGGMGAPGGRGGRGPEGRGGRGPEGRGGRGGDGQTNQ